MVINGINAGTPLPEKKPEVEKEEVKEVSREAVKQEISRQEAQKEVKKDKYDPDKMKLEDYSLKELLFLMTSRGNTETIEKLAAILKKEKEDLNSRKRS